MFAWTVWKSKFQSLKDLPYVDSKGKQNWNEFSDFYFFFTVCAQRNALKTKAKQQQITHQQQNNSFWGE